MAVSFGGRHPGTIDSPRRQGLAFRGPAPRLVDRRPLQPEERQRHGFSARWDRLVPENVSAPGFHAWTESLHPLRWHLSRQHRVDQRRAAWLASIRLLDL